MPRRRMTLEFSDADGGKFSLRLDGSLSKDKMVKLIEVFELLGENEKNNNTAEPDTQFQKLIEIIKEKFSLHNFTSSQILEAYEDLYQAPIRLGTVSTYLNRLVDKRMLRRQRLDSNFVYSLMTTTTPYLQQRQRFPSHLDYK
jgi:hypothetical protein